MCVAVIATEYPDITKMDPAKIPTTSYIGYTEYKFVRTGNKAEPK